MNYRIIFRLPVVVLYTPLQQPPPDQKNCPLKLSTSQPSIGVEKQFPCKNQIQKSGRFRDRHFCLYFELGCELAQGEAQAQNTSKNDDLENGPIFVFDFFVESTYLDPNKAGMCLVLVVNFSEQLVEVKVLWKRGNSFYLGLWLAVSNIIPPIDIHLYINYYIFSVYIINRNR